MFRSTIRSFLQIIVIGLAVSCGETIAPVTYDLAISTKESQVSSDDGFVYVTINAQGDWTIDLQYPEGGQSGWATARTNQKNRE